MTPGTEDTVTTEYQKAKAGGRQTLCPYCHMPLEISQTQYEFIDWKWNDKKKRYDKVMSGGDADKPFRIECETKDWNFIDHDLVDF